MILLYLLPVLCCQFLTFAVCCVPGAFGPTCFDCPGGRSLLCSGHGTCMVSSLT